jgi:hypothetical protein
LFRAPDLVVKLGVVEREAAVDRKHLESLFVLLKTVTRDSMV